MYIAFVHFLYTAQPTFVVIDWVIIVWKIDQLSILIGLRKEIESKRTVYVKFFH